MARFEDSKTTLHDSIRFRKHTFLTSWKDYIKIDMFGERTILKKDLSFINKNNHKELVKTKLAERKTVKLAPKDGERRGLPPVPSVPIPMAETREKTQRKLLLAELEGPMKLEGEYIKYLYFKDRVRKERGIETRTLPEIDIETRRKIGQNKEGYQKQVVLL